MHQRSFLRVIRGFAAAGLIVLLGIVASLERADFSHWPSQEFGLEALQRIEELADTAPDHVVSGELQAGFGKALLTPVIGAPDDDPVRGRFRVLPLAGYGNRHGRPARGVHDGLWTKAVALSVGGRTGVVLTADLLIVPREVAKAVGEALEERSGVGREQIYLGATHTHCSLGGWGEGLIEEVFAGEFNPPVRRWLTQQLVRAAEIALANLAPAEVGAGSITVSNLIRNRLVGEAGRLNADLNFLSFRQLDGRTALIGSYGAHATVLPGRFMEFSGDYPGVWQRALEAKLGGMAMFLAGAVGSHAPRAPSAGWHGARQMGQALAELTAEACARLPLTNRVLFGIRTLAVPLPPVQVRVSDGLRLRPWLAGRLLPERDESLLQGLRVGNAVWFSTPCDYSGELALELSEFAQSLGLNAAVTSFNGDYVGYVVPDRHDHLNRYETRTMSFHGPQLGSYFDELLRRLCVTLSVSGEQ
jgi:hypothetical protein